MFHPSHKLQLLSRLRHVDELLSGAIEALDPHREPSLFTTVVPDVAPRQWEALAAHLELFRLTIKKFITKYRLKEELSPVSALHSIRTALVFADTAVKELGPEYLRGHGEIDSRVISACEELVDSLAKLLGCMAEDLRGHSTERLLQRAAQTSSAAAMIRECYPADPRPSLSSKPEH